MTPEDINLVHMKKRDIPGVVNLIREAMNNDEADWANETMYSHFRCIENDIEDGRYYFVWKTELKVQAVTGLHHYNWGPKENVWLGWFAVAPALHGKRIGSALFNEMISLAKEMGFKKLFIETYSSPTFEKARKFYQNRGFKPTGEIKNYLPDGEAMVVYAKTLES